VTDVVIVGAGAAGLAAADALADHGIDPIVVEARDRIGGRILTIRPPGVAKPIELGAEFVHGRVPETLGITDQAAILLAAIDGQNWRVRPGSRDSGDSFYDALGRVLHRLDIHQTPDRSFDDFLAHHHFGADSATAARQYVQGFDAADPARVGEQWLAQAEAGAERDDSEHQFRLVGGYDQVPAWLAWRLNPGAIRLSSPVERVAWRPGAVAVGLVGGTTIEARAAVVTVPLSLVESITFDPPLGPEKRAAIAKLATGSVVRLVVRFQEPFWEAMGFDRLGFLFTEDRTMPTWWTTYPLRTPILTGWVGGPSAAVLATNAPDVIADRALGALATQLGVTRGWLDALTVEYWYHDWEHDPYARGAYSYGLVGGLDAPLTLRAPLAGSVFFAGEATDADGRSGTVHSAIASGRRAAAEVMQALD
jgi:monoamine oxidase